MKIFNWVHKRFQHSTLKDGFVPIPNNRRTEPTVDNADSEALLKQIALTDGLDGWKDGSILTIGTLGYDPLNSFNQQKQYLALESEHELDDEGEGENMFVDGDGDEEEDDNNVEHEELNPLMHTTFEHNYEDIYDPNPEVNASEIKELCAEETHERKKKGERITLADLFLADSDVQIKMDPAKVLLQPNDKTKSLKAKHGISLAKKLFPLVKDNSHPVKNIQRLMKKMLKKKIHPDLHVKTLKSESQENQEDNDSITLLPI